MRRHAKAVLATSAMFVTLALGVTLAGATAPVATIGTPSDVSYTSVQITGTVDPQDQETYFFFQYSSDPVNEGWFTGPFQGPIAAGAGVQNVSTELGGLRPGTEYQVRLVAENFADPAQTISAEPNPTFTTDPVGPPTALIDPVATFTGTTATFTGSVNPNAPEAAPTTPEVEAGFRLNWRFECTPACPGLQGGQIAADDSSHAVSEDVEGLDPNTDYEVTLVAENAGGPVSDGPESFKTSGVAPQAQTLYAGELGTTEATLAASVNPRNSPTTYQFEWGADESYGNAVPATPQSLGAQDSAFHVVSAPLSGLEPGETYHFRVVATNTDTSEVSEGVDGEFTTLSSVPQPINGLPDGRVYEKVSPVDKAGNDLQNDSSAFAVARAAGDGSAVGYYAITTFAGESSPFHSQYLSRRGPSGSWMTKSLSPRVDANRTLSAGTTYWLSPDLRHSVSITRIEGRPNGLYLRDTVTDQMTWLMETAPGIPDPTTIEDSRFAGASKDLGHVVFASTRRLVPEAIDGEREFYQIYDWFDGSPHLASILPDGQPAPKGAYNYVGGRKNSSSHSGYAGDNAVSEDGNRIFFAASPTVGNDTELHAYMREDQSQTFELSLSERGPCPAAPECSKVGSFQLASKDGSVAFISNTNPYDQGGFYSAPLTDDSDPNAECCDLYRWERNAPFGERLTNITSSDGQGGYMGVAGSSDDASRVYFTDSGVLAPGALRGLRNLYLWQLGSGVRFVATLAPSDEGVTGTNRTRSSDPDAFKDARVSPDGAYLLFASRARLTSYDTGGHKQIYRYDALQDELTCISCNRRTGSAIADAVLGSFAEIKTSKGLAVKSPMPAIWLPRNLSSDGRTVFFDTREALVPTDSNGKVDVYRWRDGQVGLISSGNSATDSSFLDASSSGDDIFFTTREPLVRSDSDTVIDVYDARVNGMLEPPVAQPCVGDDCQTTPSPPPAFQTPGSSTFSGLGNPSAKKAKAKKKQNKRKRRAQRSKGRHHHAQGQS